MLPTLVDVWNILLSFVTKNILNLDKIMVEYFLVKTSYSIVYIISNKVS